MTSVRTEELNLLTQQISLQEALLLGATIMFVSAILTLLFFPAEVKRIADISSNSLRDQGGTDVVLTCQEHRTGGGSARQQVHD